MICVCMQPTYDHISCRRVARINCVSWQTILGDGAIGRHEALSPTCTIIQLNLALHCAQNILRNDRSTTAIGKNLFFSKEKNAICLLRRVHLNIIAAKLRSPDYYSYTGEVLRKYHSTVTTASARH